jgi:hypothetical protein
MRIAILGSGYVGLVSGAFFAKLGHHVACIDVDAKKIRELNRGRLPIFEPGLASPIDHFVAGGRLTFTSDLAEPLANSERSYSSRSVHRQPNTADQQTYRSFTPRPRASPLTYAATPLLPPNLRRRSEPAKRSRLSSATAGPTATLRSYPTRTSCAKELQSTTSCIRTGS